jgi:alpha-methylacyl-CoA racemase
MTGTGPLSGIRVLELPAIGPVPFIGMLLADLGAEVIRIDKAASGGLDLSLTPLGSSGPLGRGRRSIVLDLRQPDGLAVALGLLPTVDIVLDGFRPGVATRLGIGPEVALERNPRVVYGQMTGWGQDGLLAPTAGHDINYLAISGLLHGIGPADGVPTPPANYVGDFGGALTMAVGLLAAVISARTTGTGQVVDVAMTDAAAYMATMVRAAFGAGMWSDDRSSNLFDGGFANYRCYECSDGGFLAVGALEPQFWSVLCKTLELDETSMPHPLDPSARAELAAILEPVFKSKTRDEWAEIFAPLDACVAPVLTLAEAPSHPHNAERDAYVTVGDFVVAAPPIRFSSTPAVAASAPAVVGGETDAILAELGQNK